MTPAEFPNELKLKEEHMNFRAHSARLVKRIEHDRNMCRCLVISYLLFPFVVAALIFYALKFHIMLAESPSLAPRQVGQFEAALWFVTAVVVTSYGAFLPLMLVVGLSSKDEKIKE